MAFGEVCSGKDRINIQCDEFVSINDFTAKRAQEKCKLVKPSDRSSERVTQGANRHSEAFIPTFSLSDKTQLQASGTIETIAKPRRGRPRRHDRVDICNTPNRIIDGWRIGTRAFDNIQR